jgi:hypothetical protein
VIDVFNKNRPGRSAEKRYERLADAWLDRTFGKRYSLYFWTVFVVAVLVIVDLPLTRHWALFAGLLLGASFVGWMLVPAALLPGHIFSWQMGAWGEQKTASELKSLRREGWVIRHDTAWGKGNHDHVLAGPAVFVVNSKNFPDYIAGVEDDRVRLRRIDDEEDSYLADGWFASARREARALQGRLRREVGFGVTVYPVIAIWARFEAAQQYVDDVSIVRGDRLVEWLKSRPIDLVHQERRERVLAVVERLPTASERPSHSMARRLRFRI